MVPGVLHRLLVFRASFDLGQILAEHLDPHRRADAGRQHVDARLIGMVQELATPGNLARRPSRQSACPAVMPGRQVSSGLRLMTVSNISIGAGSVALLARPAFAIHRSTSGKVLMTRLVVCIRLPASVTDMPGSDAACTRTCPR